MKENELVRDMYSRLNLIINELNSIGINKLGDADIVRKIISLLPQQKYGSIIESRLEGVNRRNLKIINFEHALYLGLGLEINSECGRSFLLL
jgi:hypothetical protein